jgi:hypothetical protein
MVLNGLQRESEGSGDLPVARPLGEQVEYLAFPGRQVVLAG